jgi:hypothetical protein
MLAIFQYRRLDCGALQMNISMFLAVAHIMFPTTKRHPPIMATYRLPIISDKLPTKGQTAASASKFANTNQTHLSVPPI